MVGTPGNLSRCALLIVMLLALGTSTVGMADPPTMVEAAASDAGVATQLTLFRLGDDARHSRGPVLELELDDAAYQQLRHRDTDAVVVRDFPMPRGERGAEPRVVDLELERMNVFSASTQFVLGDVDAADGIGEVLSPPDVSLFRGRLVDDAGSRVFLALSSKGTFGYVTEGHRTIVLSSGPHGRDDLPLTIYDLGAIPAGKIAWRDFVCQVHNDNPPGAGSEGAGAAAGFEDDHDACYRLKIAIDTNLLFTQDLFDGDTEAALAYVVTLVGASSDIYSYNINTEFELVFVRLWEKSDPWTAACPFWELRDYWNDNMGHIDRHLVHALGEGGGIGGGAMGVGTVCNLADSYATSCGLNGFFPYPIEDFHLQNWDILLVTHEFGHLLGPLHTHDGYCPQLDRCFGSPECPSETVCTPGTIMSYCQWCGGIDVVAMHFHPVVRRTMRQHLASVTCDIVAPECDAPPVALHVPNDVASINEAVTMIADGGTITVGPGTYHEKLILTGKSFHLISTDGPDDTAIDATDAPLYAWGSAIVFHQTGDSQITIEGFTIRGGDGTPAVASFAETGGGVYLLNSNPTLINCVIEDNSAAFGGGMANEASHPTLIGCHLLNNVATSTGGGVHSDQQSLPAISDTLFCQNTPDHLAGPWSDAGGNAFHDDCPDCAPADLNCDDVVDIDDLFILLAEWGECPDPDDCPADLDGNGVVDVDDLFILLANWG